MKSKLTTTFALLGVLATGTAAAAVNTQALQSHVESTIGANTSTLITPITADPTPQVIQLDANVSTATPTTTEQKPAKKSKASASPKPANVATVTAPTQPTFENEEEDEDDD
jgi:hypothetical protein